MGVIKRWRERKAKAQQEAATAEEISKIQTERQRQMLNLIRYDGKQQMPDDVPQNEVAERYNAELAKLLGGG